MSLLRRYRALEMLKDDEAGTVQRVMDLLRGDEVILKQVSGYERSQEDLTGEFVTLTRLRHPGLVRVLDFGADKDGRCHLTMERIRGHTLSELEGRLGHLELAEVVADVAEAVAYLHHRNVIHGDIKPDNIIIETDSQRPVLVDLGLARRPGQVAAGGSLGYLAPEALAGEPVDHRSDLYSLGATALSLMTGSSRSGSSGDPLLREPPRVTVDLLCRQDPDLPEPLAVILSQLLEPRPADRPQSADALLEALGRDVADREIAELPFVGRRDVLETLTETLPRSGAGGVILVLGEPGSGKSRLLEEFRWRAQLRGHLVLEGRHAPGHELSDSPIVAMSRVLRLITGGAEPSGSLDIDHGENRLVEFMEESWRALDADLSLQPVFHVDDVHLAGSAALDLLAFIARAIESDRRALLVLTARPGPVADALTQRADAIERLSLPPLTSSQVDSMVEAAIEASSAPSPLGAKQIQKIRKASRGSPLVLTEICRELARRGWPPDLGRDSLPRSTEEVMRWWVERLDEDQLRAVRLITLLRRQLSPALALRLGLTDVIQTLSNELACGVGEGDGSGLGVELRSPSLGEAVLADIDPRHREILHHQLVEALDKEGGSEAEVVLHRVLAGHDVSQREALHAVDTLHQRCAFGQAEELIVQRFRGIEDEPQRCPEAASRLAELASMSGQLQRGAELHRALAGVQVGQERGMSLLRLARIEERSGAHHRAEAMAVEGMSLVENSEARSEAYELLARIALMRSDYENVLRWTSEGLALPHGPKARLQSSRSAAWIYLGDPDQAKSAAEDGVASARRADDLRAEAVALGHSAMAHAALDERQESLEAYKRSLDAAERGGDVASLPIYLMNLGTALDGVDEIGQALDHFRRAELMARRLGHRSSRVAALSNLGNLFSRIGADAEARRAITASVELARRCGMDLYVAQADLLTAELEGRAGRVEPALKHLERAETAFAKIGARRQLDEVRLLRSELALQSGDLETAGAAVSAWTPPRDLEARHHVTAGKLAAARGRSEQARSLLTRAAALAGEGGEGGEGGERGQRDIEAQAEHALALLLGEAGSPLARRHRERALELMTGLALKVPASFRESFWNVPHRAEIRAAIAQESVPAARDGRNEDERAYRLLELNKRILAERDESRLLALALDIAVELCGAERGFIILTDAAKPRIVAARNIDRETIRKPRWKYSRSVATEAASTGEPVLTVSASEDARFTSARSVHNLGLQSILCVPIRTPERTLGTIYLDNRFLQGRFGPSDLRLALALADQAALALENARLHRENRERETALEAAQAELAEQCAEQAQHLSRLQKDLRLSKELRHEYSAIIGRSPAMRRVLEVIDRVTESSVPVLIEGESGTGKELCARALHENSPRGDAPFISINCSALPASLLESELFGHVRGAFTGADRHHKGLFREAHGGTLFLDEVGEMAESMQAKLLRVLQEGEVRPVGGDRAFKVDVRILAATNRSLAAMTDASLFRRDLLYRLAVVRVEMPPLSARREDLPELCDHLLQRAAKKLARPPKRIDRSALAVLTRHPLPGNVRQLENILTEALLMTDSDVITAADLAIPELETGPLSSRRKAVEAFDRQVIIDALAESGWNKRRAAAALGISRPTLYRRMSQYDIPKERPPIRI